jgi:AraC family transcriptional regulator, regulatory protein of adaptative response / methylated-DNA-[protein]-cysteine methyltransferase
MTWSAEDYSRIEKAILFLDGKFPEQPSLVEVAARVHLSPFHFQRLFKRWAGLSPKRFLQFLKADHAKRALERSSNLLDAAYAAGLSGPGRLHDLLVSVEAVTPGEFKRRGKGLEIAYGFHLTLFGECLLAATARGICGLAFVVDGDRGATLADLRGRWPGARLEEKPASTRPFVERIFPRRPSRAHRPLPLYLKGTNFQVKVWEALLRIPEGSVTSYQELAARLRRPRAARAVGNAVARNPVAFLIPCHRVIRRMGALGGYHWGPARKQTLLAWEAARRHHGA